MQLEHIALNIYDSNEVVNFYENILGFIQIKNFSIDKELAQQFFNISNDTPVYLMQKDDLVLELFVNPKSRDHGFNHICIEINNRVDLVSDAVESSYKCIRREREHFDQIFISDKSGNMFEIKEANKNAN